MPTQARLPDESACEQYYDQRYRAGYMDNWPDRKLERVRAILADLDLPADGTAVDFGCGNGLFTAVLRDRLPGWRVIGLDISAAAVENAGGTVNGCEFHRPNEQALEPGTVDFLFTHHVLEHVHDLQTTWTGMTGMMKQCSSMLHILPCGNEGSFERELCRLRTDGIDPDAGHRFFYEDEGHLRRLTTEELVTLAGGSGFHLRQEYYSHHQIEAVDWLTGNGVRFVLDICDPRRAVDDAAAKKLRRIRRRLLSVALLKSLARRRRGPLWPAAKIAERFTASLAERGQREWQETRGLRNGSEMYLVFRRGRAS